MLDEATDESWYVTAEVVHIRESVFTLILLSSIVLCRFVVRLHAAKTGYHTDKH